MLQTFEDQYVMVNGVRARYWQAGETGTPVLLLPGIGCSVLEWARNIGALAQAHRVYALDMLGDGLTEKPRDAVYTMKNLARFACDFLDAVGEGAAHFIGNSLGGRLVLEVARNEPRRVRSMVLVAAAGVGFDTHIMMRLPSVPLLGALLTRPNRIGLTQLWRLAFYNPAFVTREFVETKLQLARGDGAQAAFLKTLRDFVQPSGFRRAQVEQLQADMRTMYQPALVVWGKQDKPLPVAHADILMNYLPTAELCLFDQCGHFPQIEKADAFNEIVVRFLARNGDESVSRDRR